MGRYANAIIRQDFPDLSEDGDMIYVAIRNPKTLTLDQLTPGDVPVDGEGRPERAALETATFQMVSGLIKDWHVYDATDERDDSPALELPATPEKLRCLPFEIVQWITDEVQKVVTPPQ